MSDVWNSLKETPSVMYPSLYEYKLIVPPQINKSALAVTFPTFILHFSPGGKKKKKKVRLCTKSKQTVSINLVDTVTNRYLYLQLCIVCVKRASVSTGIPEVMTFNKGKY